MQARQVLSLDHTPSLMCIIMTARVTTRHSRYFSPSHLVAVWGNRFLFYMSLKKKLYDFPVVNIKLILS